MNMTQVLNTSRILHWTFNKFISQQRKTAQSMSGFSAMYAPTLDEKYVYQGQYQGQKWDEVRCDLVHKVFQLL